MILWELFITFMQISLLAVGGGYVAIPLMESTIVEQRAWLSMPAFADLVTIAEMTPGPIALNAATFVGFRVAGLPGALIATLGVILPSLVLVSLLFWLYRRYRTLAFMQSILKALRPVVVALIAAAGLRLLYTALFFAAPALAPTLRETLSAVLAALDWKAAVLSLAAFIVLRAKRPSPILVMAACGAVYWGLGIMGL